MQSAARPGRAWLWALLIGLIAAALYLPTLNARFINLDDPQYIYDNAYILRPSWSKLAAFFTEVSVPSTVAGYYQPLTMASLMLDRVIEGTLAGGYAAEIDPFVFHLTNVLLHGLNAALVFLIAAHGVRSRGIAAFCALLFAVHPINVEVVSWVCQRKALLSTTFALLMLWAYGRYAGTGRFRWYGAAIAAFVLSMLAKPTGALLPLVLILVDVWPLRRLSLAAVVEKVPLLVLAAIFGTIAYHSQDVTAGLAQDVWRSDPVQALLIVCHNVVFYLTKLIAPVGLCPQYPLPPAEEIALTRWPFLLGVIGTLLLGVLIVVAWRRHWRAVWTMPAAFVLLLGPALGPVRFMGAIAADRFAYMPMIALLVLLAEGLRHVMAAGGVRHLVRPIGRGELTAGGVLILGAFGFLTITQQAVWQDSRAYHQRVLEHFPNAAIGHYGMGNWYLEEHDRWLKENQAAELQRGDELLARAMSDFRQTLEIEPSFTGAHFRMGEILLLQERPKEALAIIEEGLSWSNAEHWGYFFLGLAHSHLGQYEKAVAPYKEVLRRKPSWREARRNLANALVRIGRAAEALPHYARLYELDPGDVDGLQNWGVALLMVGRPAAALAPLRAAADIRATRAARLTGKALAAEVSNLADAQYTLAAALAMTDRAAQSLRILRSALERKPALLEQARRHSAFEALRGSQEWQALLAEFSAQ